MTSACLTMRNFFRPNQRAEEISPQNRDDAGDNAGPRRRMDHTGEFADSLWNLPDSFVVDIDSNLIEYQPYRLNGCCFRYGFFGAALPIFDAR